MLFAHLNGLPFNNACIARFNPHASKNNKNMELFSNDNSLDQSTCKSKYRYLICYKDTNIDTKPHDALLGNNVTIDASTDEIWK